MAILLRGLFQVVDYILGAFLFVLFVSVLLRIVRADPNNIIVRMFYTLSEPPSRWLLRKFPKLMIYTSDGGAMDLSPAVLMLAIGALRVFLPFLQDFLLSF